MSVQGNVDRALLYFVNQTFLSAVKCDYNMRVWFELT